LQREEGLSDLLGMILVILCVWGLVSALLLQLIDIRSVFIEGGTGRLRVGLVTFALGVILLEYMTRVMGRALASNYQFALGITMLLFSAHHAFAWRMPTHPVIVFLVEVLLLAILWIVIWNISRSCSLGTRKAVEAAGDSGMLGGGQVEHGEGRVPKDRIPSGRKIILWGALVLFGAGIAAFLMGFRIPFNTPASITGILTLVYLGVFIVIGLFVTGRGTPRRGGKHPSSPDFVKSEDQLLQIMMDVPGRTRKSAPPASEKTWMGRLSPGHPGVVILYFSLVALPLFGLGVYLFDLNQSAARFRMGAYLFIYLWCALALLCLATLSQLRSYFKSRRVALPDSLGMAWLLLGMVTVSVVMFTAFLLPQPPSVAGLFVRDRVIAMYHGWEANWRASHPGSRPEGSTGRDGRNGMPVESDPRDAEPVGDRQHGDDLMKTPAQRSRENLQEMGAGFNTTMRKAFDGFITGLGCLMVLFSVILLIFMLYLFLTHFRDRRQRLRVLKQKRTPFWKKQTSPAGVRQYFGDFGDPFIPGCSLDPEQLVDYLWDAMMAWFEDQGAKIPTNQTPQQFVNCNLEVLGGFYGKALFLANLLDRSRYAASPLGGEWLPNLQDFWNALQDHARGGIK